MIASVVAGAVFGLVVQKSQLGPMLPPGVDKEFASAVVRVEERLSAGDFPSAGKACDMLPVRNIVVDWDDSKVPPALRDQFALERDRAFKVWNGVTDGKISVGTSNARIAFSFETSLPDPPGIGLPAGANFVWSADSNGPRLKVVLALQRGNPLEVIDPVNVQNEVAHAIGSYFGLATSPFQGTLMGRMELNFHQASGISAAESSAAEQDLSVADTLRAAVTKRVQVIPTRPQMVFEPQAIEMGTALQGDPKDFQIQISNRGNSPLALHFTPDCGCVVTTREAVVNAGEKFVLKGQYDTALRFGDIRHLLIANSNDADNPTVTIPIHVVVKPRYRFLLPDGNVVKLAKSGTTMTAYLVVADGYGLHPLKADVSGLPGSATIEKWSGMLADPDNNEPAQPRTGYKVTARLTGEMPVPGRSSGVLVVETDDKRFPTVVANFYAQRGIVAMPDQLYLGEMGSKPAVYSLLVSGPTGKFHVRRVSSNWTHLSFYIYPSADGSQFRIQGNYDGTGSKGAVKATMKIETDDPDQPVISVPIVGSVP